MRSYSQFCPVARALDQIGDRWVLLIIRELLIRSCRFSDLRAGLTGIASNLLTDRLRSLEETGIIERAELPPPAASSIYRLTERGQGLLPVVVALARWGEPLLADGQKGDQFAGRWLLMLGATILRDIPAPDLAPLVVELRADQEPLVIEIGPGGIDVRLAEAASADLVIDADATTIVSLLTGAIDLNEAHGRTSVQIRGEQDARIRFGALLSRMGPFRRSAGM